MPLFSLRTAASVGIGQFTDIVPLARWCSGLGLGVIQLLPLNDTGDSTSPYSALSAFALNPIYIDLMAIADAEALKARVRTFQREAEEAPKVAYARVRAFKLQCLRALFDARRIGGGVEAEMEPWILENPWCTAYAVYATLKERYHGEPWWAWPEPVRRAPEDLRRFLADLGDEGLFPVWTQAVAAQQLAAAARAAYELGVRLMGDLPILMNRDSAEVWSTPRYFDTAYQAGAPPDMFSPEGQNWGFPPYDWAALERDDYALWRNRVRQAGRFYHSIRIDHVLGFLRIWRIAADESTGILGHYHPRRHLERRDLSAFLDEGRIAWLSQPHIRGSEMDAALGSDAPRVRERYFVRLEGQDLYRLKPELAGERVIESAEGPGPARDFLLSRHRDRALLQVADGSYSPAWYHSSSSSYRSLLATERERLDALAGQAYTDSERIWEQGGRRLLAMLQESTDMLLCAEDLGAVPDCLPALLDDLGILGLRIERWARDYRAPGEPLIPPRSYPRLSVCSPSVHDTTPLRAWWEEPGWDRATYWRELDLPGPCPDTLTVEACDAVLRRAMGSASLLVIVAIQDYLALCEDTRRPDPAGERINVPGTLNDENWSYRLPFRMDELERHAELARRIRSVVRVRGEVA